jgi:hypothetical protein
MLQFMLRDEVYGLMGLSCICLQNYGSMRVVNGFNQKELDDSQFSVQSVCFNLIQLSLEMLLPFTPSNVTEARFNLDQVLRKEKVPFESLHCSVSSEFPETLEQNNNNSQEYKSSIFRKPAFVFGFEELSYSSAQSAFATSKPRRLSIRNQISSNETQIISTFTRMNSNQGFLEQHLQDPLNDAIASKETSNNGLSNSNQNFEESAKNSLHELSEFKIVVKNFKLLWTIPIKNGTFFWWDRYIEPVDSKSRADDIREGAELSSMKSPLDTKHIHHFESMDNLSIEKNSIDEEVKQYKKLYTVEFIEPQVSFVSQQAHGKIVLASRSATLELGAFDISTILNTLNEQSSFSTIISDKYDDNFYKKVMYFHFKDAQLFVAPTGIDMSEHTDWVDFNGNSLSDASLNQKSASLLEKVTEPTSIDFKYIYDTEYLFKTLKSSSSQQIRGHLLRNFATVNCMSLGSLDETNIIAISEFLKNPTSTTTMSFSPLTCCMNGRQFRTFLDVLNVFFIDPAETEAKTLYADSTPSKDVLLQKILSLVDGLILSEKTKGYNNSVMRKFEYFLESVRWIMTDDIIASNEVEATPTNVSETPGKFMEAKLEFLKGSHSFLQDGSAEIEFKLRNLELEDKLKQKKLLFPTHFSSSNAKSYWLLQISANTRAPLCSSNDSDSISQFISCTTPYSLFRVDLVPLTIDFAQDLYVVLRRYFLSAPLENDTITFIPETTKDEKKSSFFNWDSGKTKNAPSKMFWMTRDKSDGKVKVPFKNYFEHLYISKVEICANFEGFISFQNLKVNIEKFEVEKKLWDWDKLVTRLEKHVYSNVISQASDIGKSLLGGIRKNIIKKAAEMEQEDSKKDPSKFQDLKQSLLRKVAQAGKKSPRNSYAFDDEEE